MNALAHFAAASRAWKPSLHLAAVRALEAKVSNAPNAEIAAEAFREQLFIETGLSRDLVKLLVGEGIL